MRRPAMSMQYRITFSVAVGVAIILVGFGYFALTAVRDAREAAEQERLLSAQALAAHIDDAIGRLAGRVTLVSERTGAVWDAGERERRDLIAAHHALLYNAPLVLADRDQRVLYQVGEVPAMTAASRPQIVSTADGEATVWSCETGSGAPGLCLAAAVRDGAGETRGTLTLIVDVRDPLLALLPRPQLGQGAEAEIVGPAAAILVATADPDQATDHSAVLVEAIAAGQPTVSIHKQVDGEHIVAYAPVGIVPGWGTIVEQESDVALAVAGRLEDRFLLFGLAALGAAVVLAWLDVRQVVRPLRRLTVRANRMAAGDLDTPVQVSGRSEVGALARAFETMRRRLQDSLAEIARRDRDLEDRVRDRTEQVARLYEQLQVKEEARSRLLDKVISAQEEERARIARELHDETAQSLTAVAMDLESVRTHLDDVPPETRRRIQRAGQLATEGIADIRRLIANLRPSDLDALGLVSAVRALAEERLEEHGIAVELVEAGMEQRLPESVEIGLYRIIQEAISNIVRHAGASHARIALERRDGLVTTTVSDDGRGFRLAEQIPERAGGRGVGLVGMEERAGLLGGRVEIHSQPGEGTTVRATVPLDVGGLP